MLDLEGRIGVIQSSQSYSVEIPGNDTVLSVLSSLVRVFGDRVFSLKKVVMECLKSLIGRSYSLAQEAQSWWLGLKTLL